MENDLAKNMEERKSEEGCFRRLYNQVLDQFLKDKGDDVEAKVKKGIDAICNSWTSGRGLLEVNFNQWNIMGGYIYRYAPHGAGLARCRILEALNQMESYKGLEELDQWFKWSESFKGILEGEDKTLNVLSLGGGPLNDVIGFISAMSHFDFKCKLDICVVDSIKLFGDVVNITETLLRNNGGKFGKVSKNIEKVQSISFVEKTLPSEDIPELAKYDIVIMCKFLNHLKEPEQKQLMEKLWNGLEGSAVIFLIDFVKYESDVWYFIKNKFDYFGNYLAGAYIYDSEEERFGSNDHVESKVLIHVLRKKNETPYEEIEKKLAATSLE